MDKMKPVYATVGVLLICFVVWMLWPGGRVEQSSLSSAPATPRASEPLTPKEIPRPEPRVQEKEPSTVEPADDITQKPLTEQRASTHPANPPTAEANPGSLVKAAMTKHAGAVKWCYLRALERDPELEGRVDLAMTVEAGVVIDVAWEEDDTYDDVFVTCIEDRILGIEIGGDINDDVLFPFVFRKSSE
jgi:hypothetical protein